MGVARNKTNKEGEIEMEQKANGKRVGEKEVAMVKELVVIATRHTNSFNDWESGFVPSILDKWVQWGDKLLLSDAQIESIQKILDKYGEYWPKSESKQPKPEKMQQVMTEAMVEAICRRVIGDVLSEIVKGLRK